LRKIDKKKRKMLVSKCTITRSGCNTLISYILDIFCQDVIKTIAFVTHSFVEKISRVLYSDHNDITILWYNYLFVKDDHLFTIEDISLVL